MDREFGKICITDLEDGRSRDWNIDTAACERFVGGAGLAAYVYDRLVEGNPGPMDPGNLFIAMTGPLTGTSATLSGRHSFAGRSPQTGFWGEASVGGHWGKELRRTGYDGVVLSGRAAKPVYILLQDGRAEVRDAEWLWGKDTFGTDTALKEELGSEIETCVIGPAGEKLVRFAGLFTDGVHARTAGRAGLGALLGAKNVKAIVVKGSREIPVKDPDRLKQDVKELLSDFTGRLKGMTEFGTPGLVVPCEAVGDLPIRNWQQGKWTEGAQRISAQVLNETYLKKRFYCAGCMIGCGRTVEGVLGEGVEQTGGPEYETLAMLGSNCLIDSMDSLIRLNELCNRLGMDTIDSGSAVAFTMELYEKGGIGADELGSLDMTWGNAEAAERLIEMIAMRQGFGDMLAEGVESAAGRIGPLAQEYAVQTHNMAIPAHDPRAYTSIALGYSTSSRGPCHCNAFSHMFERATTFPEAGIPEVMDRFTAEGKPEMVIGAQHVMHLWDSLALCKFSIFGGVRLHHISRWLSDAAGWDLEAKDLIEAGERIYTQKRVLNLRWGWTRKDDRLPVRLLTHRASDGAAGDHLPPLYPLLADFYRLRGWNNEGVPTQETLERLGIK